MDSGIYDDISNLFFGKIKRKASYENGRTNIADMEPFVELNANGYDYTLKAYIEEPGTTDLGADSVRGYAFGPDQPE